MADEPECQASRRDALPECSRCHRKMGEGCAEAEAKGLIKPAHKPAEK